MAEEEEAPPQPEWSGAYDDEGLPHGKGTMKFPPPKPENEEEEEKPGDSYEGDYEHGKRHGKGKYTWGASGAMYEGGYSDNKKSGRGKMTFPDKSVYDGEWVDDAMQGMGTYVYANGDIYQGQFHSGKRHGQGMYHYKAVHCQIVGDWVEGGFVKGRWMHKDGSMFSGSFAKGVQPAEGAYFFSTSKLLQKGSFTPLGTWSAAAPPLIGGVEGLDTLVQS